MSVSFHGPVRCTGARARDRVAVTRVPALLQGGQEARIRAQDHEKIPTLPRGAGPLRQLRPGGTDLRAEAPAQCGAVCLRGGTRTLVRAGGRGAGGGRVGGGGGWAAACGGGASRRRGEQDGGGAVAARAAQHAHHARPGPRESEPRRGDASRARRGTGPGPPLGPQRVERSWERGVGAWPGKGEKGRRAAAGGDVHDAAKPPSPPPPLKQVRP